MKKTTIKKIAWYTLSITAVLIVVLAVHIYIVTRPKAPDAQTRIMARIDIKQEVPQEDAARIQAWTYNQTGIDHVLYNPESKILVFTFSPLKTNANKITEDFKTAFHLKAERVVATEDDLKSGCPVASTSATYKVVNFFRRIF